jgi:hypothetical protein
LGLSEECRAERCHLYHKAQFIHLLSEPSLAQVFQDNEYECRHHLFNCIEAAHFGPFYLSRLRQAIAYEAVEGDSLLNSMLN